MREMLSVVALATMQIKQGWISEKYLMDLLSLSHSDRAERFLKALLGNKEIVDALSRLHSVRFRTLMVQLFVRH